MVKALKQFFSLYTILLVVVLGFLVANAVLLQRMVTNVQREKKTAEDATKPAQLQLTILASSDCVECFDVTEILTAIKGNTKFSVTNERTVDVSSDEGVALVKKYNLTRLPMILIAGDTEKAEVTSFFDRMMTKAEDGTLLASLPPPYKDPVSGAVKGKFSVTYITDKQCAACYDPVIHRQALANLSMKPSEEKFVDRGEQAGKTLITKYRIGSTPTIVLRGDLGEYEIFKSVWPSVGTTEKDGAYVFRKGQPGMGTYHDLKTGKIIKPETKQPPAQAQPEK